MGSAVPEGPNERPSNELLVFSARVRGYDQAMTLLVDSGASQNFANGTVLKKNPAKWKELVRSGKRQQMAVRLADGSLIRSEGVSVELHFDFNDFLCREKFVVLEMKNHYDLIVGMPWLRKHQPWIDWRTRTIGNSSPASQEVKQMRERAHSISVISGQCDEGSAAAPNALAAHQSAAAQSALSDDVNQVTASMEMPHQKGHEAAERHEHARPACTPTDSNEPSVANLEVTDLRRPRKLPLKIPRAHGTSGPRNGSSPLSPAQTEAALNAEPGIPRWRHEPDRLADMSFGKLPEKEKVSRRDHDGACGDSNSKTPMRGHDGAHKGGAHGATAVLGCRNRKGVLKKTPLPGSACARKHVAFGVVQSQLLHHRQPVTRVQPEGADEIVAIAADAQGTIDSEQVHELAKPCDAGLEGDSSVHTPGERWDIDAENLGMVHGLDQPLHAFPVSAEELVKLPEMEWDLFLADVKAGEITELVVPTVAKRCVVNECNTSSNVDESVLETDKKKRFAAQGWDALRDSPFFDVLWKHRRVFPDEVPSALPPDRGIRHEIDLEPGTKYCVTRQWPLPKEQVEYIDEFFAKRAKAGQVRESKSPHCSPTFCVKKATGGWRVVHAYNKLNAASIPAQTPIPRKDVLLDSMSGSTIFSSLDLMDGYYQVLMNESDIPLTAVSTPSGMLWEWLVMPQGLKNAPATFNRLVTHILRPHRAYAPSYFDDIFVHSRADAERTEVEVHKQHLDALLQCLGDNGLLCNLKKCVIGAPEIPVLGCFVGRHGVRADPGKVKAVAEWPVPRNVKELRQWLGLANYLHKYSKNYAATAKPLSSLLKKEAEWVWTAECDAAFKELKRSLVEAPVLALPDASKPFSVVCDASQYAIGCALMQKDGDGVDRVISYQSRLLKGSELNWPVHDKELLAIKYALLKFRVHLLGPNEFVVFTDHASLRFAINTPHLSQRMARWLSFFSEYNFRVEYKPGKANVLADALSRRPDYEDAHALAVSQSPGAVEPATLMHARISRVQSSLAAEIKERYSQDEHCRLLIEHFEQKSPKLPASLRAKLSRFSWADGLLWHQLSECDYPRVCVPHDTDLKQRILFEHHDAPTSGHLGREKTFLRVSQSFWWPHLYKWVSQYVRSCEQCQRVKPAPSSSAPLKPLPIPPECWNSVSMDFVFGLPADANNNTGVVVFVDRLSKMVHLAPCRREVTGKQTAVLFLEHVFKAHGLPDTLVSDRDPRFTSAFWQHLFAQLGTKLAMSTADHPQTDGQTERVNRVLEDILRSICAAHPREWSSKLPFVEFAINNSVHSSTGVTPFFLNGLRHPRTPVSFVHTLDVDAGASTLSGGGHLAPLHAAQSALNMVAWDRHHAAASDGVLLAVETRARTRAADTGTAVDRLSEQRRPPETEGLNEKEKQKADAEAQRFLDERLAIIRRVRDAMASAQEKQKKYADQHGRKNTEHFEVGEKVLLSTATLPTAAIGMIPGGGSKLLPRFIGPYTIMERIGDVNYALDLPSYMKTHPVFYVGRLKRYVDPSVATYPAPRTLTESTRAKAESTDHSATMNTSAAVTQNRDGVQHGACATGAPDDPQRPEPPNRSGAASNARTPCVPTRGYDAARARASRECDKAPRERDTVRPPRTERAQRDRRAGQQLPSRGPMRSHQRAPPPSVRDQHGRQHYHVECLVGHRLTRARGSEYLVRWRGYSPDHDSWEPATTLQQDVPDLLAEYQRQTAPL